MTQPPTQPNPVIEPARMLRDPVLLLALGFGTGLSPKAPGTVGTLVGVALAAACMSLGAIAYNLLTLIVCVVGIGICSSAADRLGVHDHPGIVWDEIGGYLLALVLVPITPMSLLVAFIAFRIADITKPWPANVIDKRMSGGLGIMLDDIVAGVYAAIVTWVIVVWAPG